MASFDLETFLKVQGQTGTGGLEALGMAFGLPSCLLNLGRSALQLLPSSVLRGIQNNTSSGKTKANDVTKEVIRKLFLNTGIIEFDTETGTFRVKSDSSWMGMEDDENQDQNNLGGLLGAFQYAAAFGAQLYQNYTNISNEINAVFDCLDKWNELQKFQAGNSANQKKKLTDAEYEALYNQQYAGDKSKLEFAFDFIKKCNTQLENINSIFLERENDPSLEPRLLDSSELDQFLKDTNFERFTLNDPELDQEEVFRLTFGPPQTSKGQYVLTSDGLYYDSVKGGLDPIFLAISGVVMPGDVWKYDFDPNLGGKGDIVSIKTLNLFLDNIFDPSKVDDSVSMEEYYYEDHFLQVLKQQRDKHIYDLSSDLESYKYTFGENSLVVKNQHKLIMSELLNHNYKINRRKKQIEIAIKAPQVYGGKTAPIFKKGEIPINDFSYLAEYNISVDLNKQKNLIFSKADLTGVLLPYDAKYTKPGNKTLDISFSELTVPPVGKGSILYTPEIIELGSVQFSNDLLTEGTVLSLTDEIVSDGLFAIYNFLETKVELPSSTNFFITNCAVTNNYNNAQLVSPNKSSVFNKGLGIPYFEGIVKNKSSDPKAASSVGSFLKLPDTPEFRDLTFSPSGFSMDCWVYVPNIKNGSLGWLSSTTSSLTKALLACENVGVVSGVSAINSFGQLRDLDYLVPDYGEQFARGMVFGFTRDRRITAQSAGFSNDNNLNNPTSSLSIFLAPVQARDLSSASFINKSECQDSLDFYKMKVDLSSTVLSSIDLGFFHIVLTVDVQKNMIKFYADGAEIASSSITSVFGAEPGESINLPSFKKNNSFEYNPSSVDGPDTLKGGPKLNTFTTPWIVGGGYTDGMYTYGNFLGGDRGGIISGLRGHIGSLKFYSRPLNNLEVATNFKAQKGFFKNILLT